MDLRRAIKGNGGGGALGGTRKEGRRKRAMTCSVISVLCIRPRLIYREPRRGTGYAPGAHPGPSHASALPAYLLPSPFSLLGSFSLWHAFLFTPVLPSFDLTVKGKGLTVSFSFFLLPDFSLSFQECFLNLLFLYICSFVYLVRNGVCEINIIPLQPLLL